MLPLVEIDHVMFLAIFAQNLALYNKNNRVLSQALRVIGSLGILMFKLHVSPRTLIFVVIIQQIVTMPIYGKEALNICHPT